MILEEKLENKLLNKELFSSIKKDKIDLSKLHENLNKLLFLSFFEK